ncbi:hypothetical protein [Streptomyces sp. NPDC059783]|uniref:hypothetical protein n=1 Tax=Streptomyces sp. NPDC059783 TaxID=3346944 RepID=UPI00366780D8
MLLAQLLADDTNPCDNIPGAAGVYCERNRSSGGGSGGGGSSTIPGTGGAKSGVLDSLDPLHQFANSVATAADWTAGQLGKIVGNRDAVSVDFTNGGFLQQYAIVFAASTVLVLVLWLLAVAKRAVRGVSLGTAMGEAIGLLWLAVGAVAFTPLILFVLVGAVSAVTDAMVTGLGSQPGGLFESLGADLKAGKTGGGPVIQIVVSLVTLLLCGALWLLMVLRAMALYVGAILGVVVYSGLVDKDLWGHIRRWAAMMVGLILVEPIIVIVVGLASALETSGEHGTVATGLAVSVCALGAAVFLVTKFPAFGDGVRAARAVGRAAGGTARAVTGTAGAAVGVQRGISTHGGRDNSPRNGSSSSSTPRPANPVSGGLGAHGSRETKPAPKPKPKE